MKFKRASLEHKVSDCGRYTVCRVMCDGATAYEPWQRTPGQPAVRLGSYPSAAEAEARCVSHAMDTPTQHESNDGV